MSQTKEVLVQQNNIEAVSPDDVLTVAQDRILALQKLKNLALANTTKTDWVSMGDAPYLRATGAEKIGRLFGVQITNVTYKKETGKDEQGEYYFYIYTGTFSLANGLDSIEVPGTCSSRDKFFAYANKQWRPMAEIDETNIMKSAYTNMFQNGVSRLLGLRGVSWDDLKKAGLDKTGVSSVQYNETDEESKEVKESKEKKLKEIQEILAKISGDLIVQSEVLEEATAFTIDGKNIPGAKSLKAMRNWKLKRISIALTNLKKKLPANKK